MLSELTAKYMHLRRGHSAWRLLTAQRAPLVLACFQSLFENESEVLMEDMTQKLGELFAEYANTEEFEIKGDDVFSLARKEIRQWIKRRLVEERDGKIFSTDALQRAMEFVDGLEDRGMTSTASRLAVVQQLIENLEVSLNPEKESRVADLENRIAVLQDELDDVRAGNFEVLSGREAAEGVQEVYQLAMSLKSDFRRVEDSYRAADRALRQEITRTDQDRGSVLDSLLDSHDALLNTPEGQVFDGFYQQLQKHVVLDEMKLRLRKILNTGVSAAALGSRQRDDLKWLVSSLVQESQRVIEARSRSEQDVKSYVKSGLASENHRVGEMLNRLLDRAVDIDWSEARTCRMKAQLPPVGMTVSHLPLLQRLQGKEPGVSEKDALDLSEPETDLSELGDDFWNSLQSLNRRNLFNETLEKLRSEGRSLTLSELGGLCEAGHDLETIAYWLGMAREAGLECDQQRELMVIDHEQMRVEFDVPLVRMDLTQLEKVDGDELG